MLGKAAGKKVFNVAKNISTTATKRIILAALPYIATIVAVIIGIIFLVSVLAFLLTGPDMLRGQIVQMLDEMASTIKAAYVSIVEGDDYAAITKQNVLDTGKYIQSMGYDLIGYGFVGFNQTRLTTATGTKNGQTTTETTFVAGKKDISNLETGDLTMGDYLSGDKITKEGNEITDLSSNIITAYLAAENRTYMLSKVSLSSLYRWWKGVNIFPEFKVTEEENKNGDKDNDGGAAQNSGYGTGMIDIENTIDEITDYSAKNEDGTTIQPPPGWTQEDVTAYTEAVSKVAKTQPNVTPEVDRAQRKLTLTIKETGQTTTKTVYNLDGYTGRFGKPIEFLLALHLGTMAPGLALNVATNVEFDTKVHIRLHKVVEVVRVTYKDKSMTYWQEKWNERRNEVLNSMKRANNMAIQNKQPIPYPNPEARAEAQANQDIGISNKDIQNAITYQNKHNKVTYVPYISSVDHHWYKDLKYKDMEKASSDDAYVETYPTKKETTYSANSKMTVTTYKSGEIYQVKEPERGQLNEKTNKMEDKVNEAFEKLFSDKTWNRISSVANDPDKTFKVPQVAESKVTLGDDMKNAIAMIEKAAQKSKDAKYVLRDLKEWLVDKHGLKFEDQKVLTNKVTTEDDTTDDTDGTTNGNSSNNSSTTGSTTSSTTRLKNLLGGKTAPIQYSGNDAIVKTSELANGTGVNSVVGGKIIEKSDNAVQIQVTSPSSLAGKTLILSGLQMDTAIQKGAEVKTNTPLGETVSGQDMKIKLLNEYKTNISVEDNLK
mgnify:FL=1